MGHKFIFTILSVGIVLVIIVAVRVNLFRDVKEMKKTLEVGAHNMEYQLFPDRRRPMIISDKELSLRQVYPDLFNNFDDEDWREFWDIVYGAHPLIKFANDKLEQGGRNYYITEIQNVLVKRYPQVFSGFGEGHWKVFWKQIYSISSGTQVLYEDENQRERSDRRLDRKLAEDEQKISQTIKTVTSTINDKK